MSEPTPINHAQVEPADRPEQAPGDGVTLATLGDVGQAFARALPLEMSPAEERLAASVLTDRAAAASAPQAVEQLTGGAHSSFEAERAEMRKEDERGRTVPTLERPGELLERVPLDTLLMSDAERRRAGQLGQCFTAIAVLKRALRHLDEVGGAERALASSTWGSGGVFGSGKAHMRADVRGLLAALAAWETALQEPQGEPQDA